MYRPNLYTVRQALHVAMIASRLPPLPNQVCPVAIKYNKIFVDAFWNSRKESFGKHLFRLMTSWALVCDVYFLEPQNIRPGKPAGVSIGPQAPASESLCL